MRSLGKYQMIEKIGVGGFGEVWKGFDPYIKRHVAVKTCSSDSEDMRTRFFQEAEIAGNLHHKNITTVYDFGVQDGLPYLIQEYLTGEDLDRKVKRRDFLPYPEKLFYLLQIARGLAYAHSKGVIHRDIKPANIRILEDGTAKIMDFGIAKLAQQETGLTQTGMTLGTAAYLAPEQIKGESVDTSTDIFSFGVLAYELLTYQRPFPGEQISAVLYALLHTDPQPVNDHWPAAPQDIVDLIDCCLTKNAAGRYASGGELQRALELIQKQGAMERTGSGALPEPAPPSSPAPPASGPQASGPPASGLPASGLPASGPPPAADPTPTPTRLDELEITIMGSGAVPAPPPQPASGSAGAELQRDTTPASGIDTGGPGGTVGVHGVSPSVNQGSKQPSRAPWIVVAILAVIAGVGGWWLGSRADDSRSEPPPVEDVDSSADDGADESGESVDGLENDADESDGQAADKQAVRARVVVRAPSWTDKMTLQVNSGTVRGLVKNQEIPLGAGRHTLDFAVDETGFSKQSRMVVQLAEGQRMVVSPDIREPATLTVRPLPRTPQGLVSVDNGAPLSTPVSNLFVEPGSRTIEIAARSPADDGTMASLVQTINLSSGQHVILSFDLGAGQINVAER